MASYLFEVNSGKYGVMHPVKVGPFPDDDAAREFANAHQMGNWAETSGEGGYSAVHVISDAAAQSPEAYHAEWAEDREDVDG